MSIDPSGTTSLIGRRQPSFSGIGIVDQGADDVERGGADDRKRRVEIVGQLVARAGEVERRRTRRLVDA